jgi:hypothetical protein
VKKFFIRYSVLLSCLSMTLVGCSSIKYQTGLEFKAPEFGGGGQQDEVKYPKWYTEKPSDGDTALYAVASEYSKDFQFSVDKAMLSAKRELASNFSSHVDAMLKDYVAEVGDIDSSTIQEINRTTKLIVSRVNLIGVQRTNFKVVHEKDGFRSYVKLRYVADQSNKLLVQEVKKNRKLSAKLDASKSFQELEESVKNIEVSPVQ